MCNVAFQLRARARDKVGALRSKPPKQESDLVQASCVSEAGASTRVLSSQELQVKSLADKAASYKQQAKAMKARQQLAKAQHALIKAH